jgi:CheY-like chemotaxis protein
MGVEPKGIPRVLVVEDDGALARACVRTLWPVARAEIARSSEEAVVRLQSEASYAVLLSDFGLPGRDGLWLLAECRRRWPAVRRVLTSGEPAGRFAAALLSGLADRFLPKPVDRTELLSSLPAAPPRGASCEGSSARGSASVAQCRLCRGTGWLCWAGAPRPRVLCAACGGDGRSR